MNKKTIELLAPAGNVDTFNAALNAGADAIYLGVERFSARSGAGNFSIDQLKEAILKAHLRGVRVYVAFNTIIADEELASAAEYLAAIYGAGVDAVIVQDWGVFKFVKDTMPDLPVHASTQMNAHNPDMVRFIEEQGAKRVTLARELSVEEIANICSSTGIEVECFIHGTLCFSYSGQCLFSSMVGNRSGNRGMCPQACRLPYELSVEGVIGGKRGSRKTSAMSVGVRKSDKNAGGDKSYAKLKNGRGAERNRDDSNNNEAWETPGKHIMSASDLCGIGLIPQLVKAGVSALKIEGRMKNPEYVAIVVSVYRRAIDRYLDDPDNYTVSEADMSELIEVYNRGFSESYLSGIRDPSMMSFERPSDRGVFVGRVTYLDIYKARLGIELKQDLYAGDEIEAWVSQGGRVRIKADEIFVGSKKVEIAEAGLKVSIVVSEKRHKINTGDRVFRVHSELVTKKAKEIIKGSQVKRVSITMGAEIKIGKPVTIEARLLDRPELQDIKINSNFSAEVGERRTLSEADVISQLNRLGNTVYQVESWNIEVEPGAMVPLGKLNELRRVIVEKLDSIRIGVDSRSKVTFKEVAGSLRDAMKLEPGVSKKRSGKKPDRKPVITVDVSSLEQAERVAINGADWIYYRPGLSRFISLKSNNAERISNLKAEHGVKVALATGNILHEKDIDAMQNFIGKNSTVFDAVLVDNFGLIEFPELAQMTNTALFIDYHINVFNRLSARFMEKNGASRVCLSTELTLDQMANIASAVKCESEAIVHGWLEVMTAEHCVPSASKESCSVCKKNSFIIEDEKGFRFPVEQDSNCRSHIYNSREWYLLPNLANIVYSGVSSLRLLLNRYSSEDAGKATSIYREALDLVWAGSSNIDQVLTRAEKVLPGLRLPTTSGHYFREVQ